MLEGIMMKNREKVAIAVRRPDGGIEVDKRSYDGVAGGIFRKIPFIRGIFSFLDSLVLGTGCLNYSAGFYEEESGEEEEEPGAFEKFLTKIFGEKTEDVIMGIITVISFIIAIGIFMILPYFLVELLRPHLHNESLLAIIEGALRLGIFLVYVVLISFMKDIRRVYMYHGAEHKCINCVERGYELTVHNVMRSSRMHKRCGTSFLLFVMLVSIVLFFFIRMESPLYRLLTRIALIPVIAGISYEIIRLAGKTDFFLVQILSAPGLLLQRLTTREPTEDMVEVAIKAVEAVFDWKTFLRENFDYDYDFEEEAAAEAAVSAEAVNITQDAADATEVNITTEPATDTQSVNITSEQDSPIVNITSSAGSEGHGVNITQTVPIDITTPDPEKTAANMKESVSETIAQALEKIASEEDTEK